MRYSTRTEAIEQIIIAAIEAGGEVPDASAEYDIDAIAEEVISGYLVETDEDGTEHVTTGGYEQVGDAEDFWAAVARHAH